MKSWVGNMSIRGLFILLFAVVSLQVCASEDRVTLRGTYDYEIPEYQSQKEARREAAHHARTQAMAEKFGSVVSQDNTAVLFNDGQRSTSQALTIANDLVRGEWLGDIEEPCYELLTDGLRQVLRVTVYGYAREIKSAGTDITAKTLRHGTTLRHEGREFNTGDNIYLYFKSPADGYVTVFLIDETQMTAGGESVYSLLPYQASGTGAYKVRHDKEYVFFSEAMERDNPTEVDELIVTATHPLEYNDLLVVFSPNAYSKSVAGSASRTVDGLILPRSLRYDDFRKWLAKYRDADKEMQVVNIPIIIRK